MRQKLYLSFTKTKSLKIRSLRVWQTAVFWTLIFSVCVFSQNPVKIGELPEAPTTKEMNGSGRHIYEFEIKKDEFFQVKARQAGVDVMLRLSDSQKNEVAGMDSPNGDLGFEILTFVPATTGIFTLEVVGFNPNAGQGNYIIQRLPRRAATENDRKRVLTERKFTEGVDAINSTDETVIKIALENLKGAMTGWQQLEDEGMVFITKDAINALNTILDQIQAEKTPQLVVKTSHGMITSIAFSLDNTLAAAGGSDGTIKLWEVGSGRQIRTLRGHQPTKEEDKKNPNASESLDPLINAFENIDSRGRLNTPFSVSFSPDGKTLASGSNARTIILWDVATGKSKITITSPVSVWFVAFSKDGQSLLARSEFKNDTAYRFYNAGNGEEIKENPPPLSQFNIPWQNQATKQEALSDPEDTNVKILNPNKTTFSLTGHTGGVRHAIFNPAGDILASGGWDRSVRLWDFKNKKLLKILGEHDSFISYLTFSADGKLLASGSEDGVVKIWDMTDKTQKMELRGYTSYVSPYGFGKNNDILVTATDNLAHVWDLETGGKRGSIRIHTGAVHNIVFSRDKNFLATSDQTVINIKQWARLQGVKLPPDFGKWVKGLSSDETIRVFNMKTGKLKELTLKPKTEVKEDSLSFEVSALVFSHNSKMLAASGNKIVKIWKIETDEEPIVINEEASSLAFSRDDKVLALGDYYGGQIKLRNLETKKQVALPAGKDANYYLEGMAFSEKDKNLVCYLENYERKKLVRVYDLESSALKEEFYPEVNPDQYIRALRLVPDLYQEINFPYMDNNRFYAAPNLNGRIGLYDNGEDIFRDDDDKLIAWLITLDKSDWAVVTPNGRFDTNNLEDSQGLNWIFPDAPLKPLPFEVLMRDYYEPGLLPRLIKCTENKNCETEFKLISRDVSALNRTLPKVEITKIQPTSEPDVVKVTVEVTDRESDFQKDQQGKFLHSGVEDLRIFRDGKLVGYAPQPENENKIRLDKNGKASFTFDTKLPRSSNIKEVEFSAYAFNSDHIRSEISRKIYKLEKPLPDIKGKAYLFTIGVNTNESPALSLSYAAKDALDLQDEVAPRLKASGKYADVVQISLISAELDGKSITDATKAKIKAVFDILAGKKVPAEILAGVPNAEKLSKVQPEDFVLIAFSGHGYADQNGIFYFVPYDTGNFATARQNEKLISSNDLSFWLRDIDAREMIMIVDACHSAAAFQDKGFKPGPIGSQGLAQLSYDKGIQILAATQANNAARETEELKNGLLTYALTKDGIRENKADSEPQDKILMSNEWLSFAVRRVPELYEAQRKKKNAAKVPPPPDVPIDALNDNSKDGVQQPVLFNFNKRHSTFELWKIQ